MSNNGGSNGKKYIRGHVDGGIFDEFIGNIFPVEGPKHGFQGRGLEQAMKIYNLAHQEHYGISLFQMAVKERVATWELADILIDSILFNYTNKHDLEACLDGLPENQIMNKIHENQKEGYIDQDVKGEFEDNALNQCGPKHGYKCRALETSLRMYNSSNKKIGNTSFIEIAEQLGLEVWELNERIMKTFVEDYTTGNIKHSHLTNEEIEGLS